MKKTLTLLAAVLAFVTTSFAQTEDGIKWEKKSHDFGSIKMGPKAEVTFRFTNTTKAPVVITAANPSCGCTASDYTKTPIMPGKTGEVTASYGTDGRPGFFQKSIKVSFDNGSSTDLIISGTVTSEAAPAPKNNELK
jgi:hypothetical protein